MEIFIMIDKKFFSNKKILVTGGTGMIGYQLVKLLSDCNAKITVVSLDNNSQFKNLKFIKSDLRDFENCLSLTKNKDIVFHLAGVKGSPKMTLEQPASFMIPTLMFSINMMEAARRNKVNNYLFTSSVGVYEPKEILKEDDVWKSFPSENDKFAGWAKRICELQAEAYEIQYGWNKISIVRPANVYGPYDNFDTNNAMVIPSLIRKAVENEKLFVWGDGSPTRDFIFSEDVAKGMMLAVQKNINKPINLGSGKGYKIKEIAETIINILDKKKKIIWEKDKPMGDKKRIMSIERAKKIGFEVSVGIKEGLERTIKWYLKKENKNILRYNSFTENL